MTTELSANKSELKKIFQSWNQSSKFSRSNTLKWFRLKWKFRLIHNLYLLCTLAREWLISHVSLYALKQGRKHASYIYVYLTHVYIQFPFFQYYHAQHTRSNKNWVYDKLVSYSKSQIQNFHVKLELVWKALIIPKMSQCHSEINMKSCAKSSANYSNLHSVKRY